MVADGTAILRRKNVHFCTRIRTTGETSPLSLIDLSQPIRNECNRPSKVLYRTARSTILGVWWVVMPRKTSLEPHSSSVLDYSESMSLYERESLAAEATLKAEREKKKPPKAPKS